MGPSKNMRKHKLPHWHNTKITQTILSLATGKWFVFNSWITQEEFLSIITFQVPSQISSRQAISIAKTPVLHELWSRVRFTSHKAQIDGMEFPRRRRSVFFFIKQIWFSYFLLLLVNNHDSTVDGHTVRFKSHKPCPFTVLHWIPCPGLRNIARSYCCLR